jgi:hypothetical protein
MTATPHTPATLATEFGTDSRTMRKFLRSITPKTEQPGKGGRWALPTAKREVASLRKQFAAWGEEQAKLAADRAAAKVETAAQAVDEEIAELDAETAPDAPSDDDLAMIDAETDDDDAPMPKHED